MNLTKRILKAINEGISDALSDLDKFDPEYEVGYDTNVEADQIINHLKYEKPSDFLLALKLYNETGAKYHYGKNGDIMTLIRFKDFVMQAISALGDDANLNWIDTQYVTDLSNIFNGSNFVGDISEWDLRSCRDFSNAFKNSKFRLCPNIYKLDIEKNHINTHLHKSRYVDMMKGDQRIKSPQWYKEIQDVLKDDANKIKEEHKKKIEEAQSVIENIKKEYPDTLAKYYYLEPTQIGTIKIYDNEDTYVSLQIYSSNSVHISAQTNLRFSNYKGTTYFKQYNYVHGLGDKHPFNQKDFKSLEDAINYILTLPYVNHYWATYQLDPRYKNNF